MKVITAETPLPYVYDPNHARASYSLNDGKKWMNHGEFCERMTKAILGFAPSKDSLPFDKNYDIPELKASVKSYKCGLTDKKDMPNTPAEFLSEFWRREIAELHIYACDHGEYFTLYLMDTAEFKGMVEALMGWDNSAHNFRMYKCDNKVETWLLAHYAEK